jgi:hypothetical protein
MSCPICRRPVVRDLTLSAKQEIAHRGCVDRREGQRASEIRRGLDVRSPQPVKAGLYDSAWWAAILSSRRERASRAEVANVLVPLANCPEEGSVA